MFSQDTLRIEGLDMAIDKKEMSLAVHTVIDRRTERCLSDRAVRAALDRTAAKVPEAGIASAGGVFRTDQWGITQHDGAGGILHLRRTGEALGVIDILEDDGGGREMMESFPIPTDDGIDPLLSVAGMKQRGGL